MSQGSSNSASPSRPVPASEQQETITPVSHVFGLLEVSTSLEALNIEVEKKPNMVHRAQTSYSPGVSQTPWSPNMWDNRRSTLVLPQKPKRYALQTWLEVEVGSGYFLPPEDDFCSMDFTLEVLNRTYPGCTGVYLDRAGHMLAFYGRKGGSKVGLIQEVAIEAGRAVTEIPTWMGLTARWKVRCVSLAEANDILAGCKRLEQEKGRSVCTSRKDLPPCTNPLASQLLLLLSSHGPLYQCLGWLRWPVIHMNERGVGQRPASLHPVAQPPPPSVRCLHPHGVHIPRPLMMMRLQT